MKTAELETVVRPQQRACEDTNTYTLNLRLSAGPSEKNSPTAGSDIYPGERLQKREVTLTQPHTYTRKLPIYHLGTVEKLRSDTQLCKN